MPPDIQSERPRKSNTRNRILLMALSLFNEAGVAKTTTNHIADELDISPGNLHYHFRTKADLVSAIVAEFEADSRVAITPPGTTPVSIDDIWVFMHLLLERLSMYRFLFRDFETVTAEFPDVEPKLRRFVVSLAGNVALHLLNLEESGALKTTAGDRLILGRSIVVQMLFSERLDALTGVAVQDDNSTVRAAQTVLHLLLPYLKGNNADLVRTLLDDYR
jgi:AcrR family transcriptional regulator